jgi:hypothetical protein
VQALLGEREAASVRAPCSGETVSHRLIKASDFVGKTISRIDAKCVNVTRFWFTDGTAVAIEVDAVGPGIYGMVSCEECAPMPARKRKLAA